MEDFRFRPKRGGALFYNMNKLAIAIRVFNRPHYFQEEVASLEKNELLDKVDFHLYLGAGINKFSGEKYADSKDLNACMEIMKAAKFPNKFLTQYEFDTGNALEELAILDSLEEKYDYFTVIDDDLLFNKYYIKTLLTLFEQFKDDPLCGMIQTSFRKSEGLQNRSGAFENEDKVAYGYSYRCEQGYWKNTWRKIRRHYIKYIEMVNGYDFIKLYRGEYPDLAEKVKKEFGDVCEDSNLELAAQKCGYRGLHTLSLRYKIIGAKGAFSFAKDRWGSENLGQVELFDVGNVDKYKLTE